MVAHGLGHSALAMAHLITHACFKAALFLGAGAIEPATLFLGQLASFYLIASTTFFIPLIGAIEHESIVADADH